MALSAYVISLADRTDRLESARKQMELLGLDYQVVQAIDGRGRQPTDYPEYDDRAARRKFGRSLLGAEVACYLSHIKALESFIETGEQAALIVEDDCVWTANKPEPLDALVDLLTDLDRDWHLMNLGYPVKRIFTPLKATFAGSQICRGHHFPTTSTAILWSRQGALRFLRNQEKIALPYDHALRSWVLLGSKALATQKGPFSNSNASSDIVSAPDQVQLMTRKFVRINGDKISYQTRIAMTCGTTGAGQSS